MTPTELIVAEEAMTLPTLVPFQERLLAAFITTNSVTVDPSCLVHIDVAFVQLIAAARAFAKTRGVSFTLSGPVCAAVEAVLHRAGFLEDPGSDDTAFWLKGANR